MVCQGRWLSGDGVVRDVGRHTREPDICRSGTTPWTWQLSIYFRSDHGNDRFLQHDKSSLRQGPIVALGKGDPFYAKHKMLGTRNNQRHVVEPPFHALFDFDMEQHRCRFLTTKLPGTDRLRLGSRRILPPRISGRGIERTLTRLFHMLCMPQVILSRREAGRA